MENKTRYQSIRVFGVVWMLMRQDEGKVTKKLARLLTLFDPMFN